MKKKAKIVTKRKGIKTSILPTTYSYGNLMISTLDSLNYSLFKPSFATPSVMIYSKSKEEIEVINSKFKYLMKEGGVRRMSKYYRLLVVYTLALLCSLIVLGGCADKIRFTTAWYYEQCNVGGNPNCVCTLNTNPIQYSCQ